MGKKKKKAFLPHHFKLPCVCNVFTFLGTLPTRLSLVLFHLKSLQGYRLCVVVEKSNQSLSEHVAGVAQRALSSCGCLNAAETAQLSRRQ